MKFSHFKDQISLLKTKPLGGLASQFKLVPDLRIKISEEKIKNSNPRKAAIMALFYPNEQNKTTFLLTQRASYNGTHSAQISFPGGKYDQGDHNIRQTALRELEEEVGVYRNSVKVIRQLSDTYIPPSNFMVTPFLGFLNEKPSLTPNKEVAKLIEIEAAALLNDENISSIIMETSYMKGIEVPCFKFHDHIVWGATAMMLSEIKDLMKEIE
ncbi:coenzyme A pyrophosphatase [Tenacibaculum sp. SZ-18]|uniref:NUDIX hydrolase n=1 Tax=Tenacibaculum sp. SZ-18 TaxID=754423 RepID=UPI000C2D32CC|nr:CoA pyrophosphatase [Tenacibaculum sp. SZ-18]AUC15370.1 coenzyme A pyrophosphatase [Tenacibaculum sp. SZ-18]